MESANCTTVKTLLIAGWTISTLACASPDQDSPEYPIAEAVQKYHAEFTQQPYAAPASYVEKALCDMQYCKFTEGYGHYMYLGEDGQIPMVNRVFLADQIKRSNPSQKWLDYVDSNETPEIQNRSDFQPGYISLLGAVRRMELNGILNEHESQNYEYARIDTVHSQAENMTMTLKIDFSSGDELYEGTAYINPETSRFKRITLNRAPIYAQPLYGWQNAEGEMRFKTGEDGTYHPEFIRFEYTKGSLTHSVALKGGTPARTFDEIDDETYNELYNYSINPVVHYDEEHHDPPFVFHHQDMEKIRQNLTQEEPLSQQFKSGAGSPYFTITDREGNEIQPSGSNGLPEIVKDL